MSETLHAPIAYFITFTCYGTWLHGDARGSVRRPNNGNGMPTLPENPLRRAMIISKMRHPLMYLGPQERGLVDTTVREVCEYRGWELDALNVRTNHVHILVTSTAHPDKVMNDIKAWCTRRLREEGLIEPNREVWTSHGSTRWLWKEEHFRAAWEYVTHGQGAELPRDWPPDDSPPRT